MALAILGCFLLLPGLFGLYFTGRTALTWVPVVMGATILLFTALRFACKKVKIC
jgi:hypothetical protein